MQYVVQPNPKHDYLSSRSASNQLASNIEEYWSKKGYTNVRAWVEKQDYGRKHIYVVRSNLSLKPTT